MKILFLFALAVICSLVCETTAQRAYYYGKPGQFLSDAIDQEYIRENNETVPHFVTNFGKNRPRRRNACANCHCGWPNTNRIVGGTAVRYNKYPWMTQLKYDDSFYCGGSLINNLYVATAAHCTTGFRPTRMSVRILQYDRNIKSDGISRKVSRVIAHPKYNTKTLDNDIALLRLDTPVPLSGTIRPVCLPQFAERFDDLYGIATGWGLTSENGQVSDILREVGVKIISNTECKNTRYKALITENMLCAGDVRNGGKDACQGDSGGPLIVSKNSHYVLSGVVSFGFGCAQPNAPGVYARVSKYLDWINKITADACYCNQ